jgi:hypothetical protein
VLDAYVALKDAVVARFAGRPAAEVVLAEHAEDPQTYAKPLEKQVREAGLAEDQRVVELARALLQVMRTEGGPSDRFGINLAQAQGVQVGDHNEQTNTFH